MSDREITRTIKAFAQCRLKSEYGFAPALKDIEIQEAGYSAEEGMTIGDVGYAAVSVGGKYYSIRWDSVKRLPEYGIK